MASEDPPRARAVARLGAPLEKVEETLDAPGLFREVLAAGGSPRLRRGRRAA